MRTSWVLQRTPALDEPTVVWSVWGSPHPKYLSLAMCYHCRDPESGGQADGCAALSPPPSNPHSMYVMVVWLDRRAPASSRSRSC